MGGLDKMGKNVYVYYSGPTDDTGKKIAEALKASHGKTKPATAAIKPSIVIGWGCKTDKPTNMGTSVVLNHPDKIRLNRNKFETLKVLEKAGVAVAPFVSADAAIAEHGKGGSAINLPLVGRKKFHQGGKGFWTCLTETQLKKAINQGAEYFQNFLDIKTEYRLHVFQGKVINMQKKVERANMSEAFIDQHGERITNVAAKNGKKLDKDTMDYVLGNLGKRQERPDEIIKSNTRGWKFSQITKAKQELKDVAIKAVKAIGLDFGAVDCCETADGEFCVIEVNTGPGLKGTPFDAYIVAFNSAIAEINATGAKKVVPATEKSIEVKSGGSLKDKLATKANLMAEMVKNADEDEAAALQNIFKKMWSE